MLARTVARPRTLGLQVIWKRREIPRTITHAANSLSAFGPNSDYGEIVRSSLSSAGSMMLTSIDPHALHLKL